MKVLHVIPSLSPRNGGPSHAIPGMCRALVKQGQEVTLFTTNIDGPGELRVPLNRPVLMDGVEVRYFQVRRPRSYSYSFSLAKALRDEVKRFDLVHIHSIFNWPITPAAYFCRKYGVPYIVRPCGILDPVPLKKAYGGGWVPVGIDLKRRYLKRRYIRGRSLKSIYLKRNYLKKILYLLLVEKRNLEAAAAIHFTSREETRATEPYGIRAHGFIVPLGVDLTETRPDAESFRQRHPSLNGQKIVLFLSRLDAKKGLDLLIPALGGLTTRGQNFTFVLGGSGEPDYEEDIRKQLHWHGLSNRTILTGFVDGKTKWSIFKEADIFVLPSYHENFGLAVVEAMSVGLPVVISDQVGIHRDVYEAGAGLVVPQNTEELANAIGLLLDNCDLRETMGKKARQLVEGRFSWDLAAKELNWIYKDVLDGTRLSAAWIKQSSREANRVEQR